MLYSRTTKAKSFSAKLLDGRRPRMESVRSPNSCWLESFAVIFSLTLNVLVSQIPLQGVLSILFSFYCVAVGVLGLSVSTIDHKKRRYKKTSREVEPDVSRASQNFDPPYSVGCKSAIHIDNFPLFVSPAVSVELIWQGELFTLMKDGVERRLNPPRSFIYPLNDDDASHLYRCINTKEGIVELNSKFVLLNDGFKNLIDDQVEEMRQQILYPIKLRGEFRRIEFLRRSNRLVGTKLGQNAVGQLWIPIYSSEVVTENLRRSYVTLSRASTRTASTHDPESPRAVSERPSKTLMRTRAMNWAIGEDVEAGMIFDIIDVGLPMEEEMMEDYRRKMRDVIEKLREAGARYGGMFFRLLDPLDANSSPVGADRLLLVVLKELLGEKNISIQRLWLNKEGWCCYELLSGINRLSDFYPCQQIEEYVGSIVEYEDDVKKGKLGVRVINEGQAFRPCIASSSSVFSSRYCIGNVLLVDGDIGQPSTQRVESFQEIGFNPPLIKSAVIFRVPQNSCYDYNKTQS